MTEDAILEVAYLSETAPLHVEHGCDCDDSDMPHHCAARDQPNHTGGPANAGQKLLSLMSYSLWSPRARCWSRARSITAQVVEPGVVLGRGG
jgi:hypothetical protein